jgi:type IV pilus assembly protein PilV
MNSTHKQSGFTMLEALIALVIVSLGLLGIAGIIANSLKLNQGAQARSQASWLANDIIDRMRANRGQAADYAHPSCANAPAASDPVVAADLEDWCDAVVETLPDGTGSVAFTGDRVTVSVTWDDSSRLADAAVVDGSGEFVVETRL